MLQLVLIVCLMAKPDRCEEVYLAMQAPGSMMQCMVDGQKQAAEWLEEHPGYVLKRWRCGEPRA